VIDLLFALPRTMTWRVDTMSARQFSLARAWGSHQVVERQDADERGLRG
jgi:hypothetical protein